MAETADTRQAAGQDADDRSLAERLICKTIGATWLFYAIGGLYIAGPVLGWTLTAMALWRLYAGDALPPALRPARMGSISAIWLIGMAVMLVDLWIGHALNHLGTGPTIKSSVGWAKGWALLALYPFASAVLNVRAEPIYRAICKLGRQTLILMPLFLLAPTLHLPGHLYVSPLQIFGGSGPEYFAVMLFTIEPETGAPRWLFFAPWAPAAGMVAVVHILCAIEERNLGWKITGIIAGVLLALLTQSRLALVAIAVIWPVSHGVARLSRASTWWAAAPAVLLSGMFAPAILAAIEKAQSDFTGARASSSRVRAALGRIAVNRWQTEAPWFGHGIVESGPHLVEFMPIGSHHSWYGLLFVKGIVGVAALAAPMVWSAIALARLSFREPAGRVGFSMLLTLFLYSFGENLEVLGYLYWPALCLIGIAARQATDPEATR